MIRRLRSKVLAAFAASFLAVPAATAQIQASKCSAIFVTSSAKSVNLNCGSDVRQLQIIRNQLNRLLANDRAGSIKVDELVAIMNMLFEQGTSNFGELMRRTDVLDQKSDKIMQLLTSLIDKPEETARVLANISPEALSYNRTSGPLSLQILNAYQAGGFNIGSGNNVVQWPAFRFVFRLGTAVDRSRFYIGALRSNEATSGLSQIKGWQLLGEKGSACFFRATDPGMTISTGGDLNGYDPIRNELDNSQLPLLVSVYAICPTIVKGEPLSLAARLYFREADQPLGAKGALVAAPWQVADFRFDGIVPTDAPN